MDIRFSKMHGCGNDFVVIERLTQTLEIDAETVRELADRRFGIGCDQLLLVDPPETADVDFRYRIFNADGGEVAQCGNGARCFARFVHDKQLCGKSTIRVMTASGVLSLQLTRRGHVRVDMGAPQLDPADIPLLRDVRAQSYTVQCLGETVNFAAVSMGNPHAVITVDDLETHDIERWGRAIQALPDFPEGVNVGFLQIKNRGDVGLRVYERGAGETLACGSGACAAVVAGILDGRLSERVHCRLRGGALSVEWPGEGQPVIMIGPATPVFDGVISLKGDVGQTGSPASQPE